MQVQFFGAMRCRAKKGPFGEQRCALSLSSIPRKRPVDSVVATSSFSRRTDGKPRLINRPLAGSGWLSPAGKHQQTERIQTR